MDHFERREFVQRLLSLLKKTLQSKNVEDFQMSKVLSSIDDELRVQLIDVKNLNVINEWLLETIVNWKKTQVNLHEAQFISKFIGLLSKYNEAFKELQNTNFLNDFISLLKHDLLKHTTMQLTVVKMLCTILGNNSGCAWVKASQVWKLVVSIYLSSANLYVEREAIKFFAKLISAAKNEENINEDLLSYVFLPVEENFTTIVKEKKLNPNILLFLKLLQMILKENMFSERNHFLSQTKKFCSLETFLGNVVENSEEEISLAALQSQILWSLIKFEDKEKFLSFEHNPAILDPFKILIEQKKFNSLMKLAKYCQIIWNEMRIQKQQDASTEVNFILMQLFPSLICMNMPIMNKEYDLLLNKLFSQNPQFQKFFHLMGDTIKSSLSSKPEDLAVKGILSVITNLDGYNYEEAILILQTILFVTKYIISENGYDLETAAKKHKKLGPHGVKNKPLLSAILNGVPPLLEKFKISWTDIEAQGLFKIIQCLLKMSDLPSLVVSQTLVVFKVAVLNCISPSAVLSTVYANLEYLAPIIYELMTDSSWETRDTCIEVLIAIAELSESKYPSFEQVLLKKNFHSLLLNIVENDMESYVRASAIRALTVMTKIDALNPFLNDKDSCLKIIKLLETDSEGIVRREAALLIKEIYLTLNDQQDDLVNLFYRVMGNVALCDLYWEVKINCLVFWEAVIQCIIADQRIIQKPLPNGACSKKEVINFSKDDMKPVLYKSLKKLSKIGCLYVLWTILKEDCDMIVIKKSAEVLSYLLNVLKDFNIIQNDNLSSTTSIYRKRKNSGLIECENNKIPSLAEDKSTECEFLENNFSMSIARSEEIIEEIINDTDINLLKAVPFQNEEIDSCHKSVSLKEIELEVFLLQMQKFDKDQFLENKQKSFVNVETDLALTMDEISIEHLVNEINVMDCY